MAEGCGLNGLELRSRISKGGVLELSLQEAKVPEPEADEIIVRVEAAYAGGAEVRHFVSAKSEL
jgi:NADPH:quinone reductase-like Zn-dependent oxidoreductase